MRHIPIEDVGVIQGSLLYCKDHAANHSHCFTRLIAAIHHIGKYFTAFDFRPIEPPEKGSLSEHANLAFQLIQHIAQENDRIEDDASVEYTAALRRIKNILQYLYNQHLEALTFRGDHLLELLQNIENKIGAARKAYQKIENQDYLYSIEEYEACNQCRKDTHYASIALQASIHYTEKHQHFGKEQSLHRQSELDVSELLPAVASELKHAMFDVDENPNEVHNVLCSVHNKIKLIESDLLRRMHEYQDLPQAA